MFRGMEVVSTQLVAVLMGNNDLEDEVEARCLEPNIVPLARTTTGDKCPPIELEFLLLSLILSSPLCFHMLLLCVLLLSFTSFERVTCHVQLSKPGHGAVINPGHLVKSDKSEAESYISHLTVDARKFLGKHKSKHKQAVGIHS